MKMLKAFGRCMGCVLVAAVCGAAWGQTEESKGVGAVRVEATALRDEFVKATVAAGMSCPIAPPKIVVEDVPSYGQYDPEMNTLKTSAWELLSDEEKSGFFRMLGPGATEDAARKEFEIGAHHWVFVHELGHWWQECRGVKVTKDGYAFEAGANRVAAAYWREKDAAVIAHQKAVFEMVQAHVPNPVPTGQSAEAYFNAHYPDTFPSVVEYIWFQARMCLAAFDEKPAPTFAQALKETGAVDTAAAVEATRVNMTAVRNAFVKATVDAGFTCPIAPPTVVVMDVPSYGNYDVEKNVVETPAWEILSERSKGLMYQLAGPGATEEAARAEFETDSHHWVFIHELGHWFQACRGVPHDARHWAKESGANRISAAYWRERDAAVVPHMRAAFETVVSHAPNPVPEGQDMETYFNANYERLGPTPAYIWFASKMSIVVIDERPIPTFKTVLGRLCTSSAT
jgi:hypothetical protein